MTDRPGILNAEQVQEMRESFKRTTEMATLRLDGVIALDSHERLLEQGENLAVEAAVAETNLGLAREEIKRLREQRDEARRIETIRTGDLIAAGKVLRRTQARLTQMMAALEQIPCQMVTTIEDCNVAVAKHVRHPERYEKLPRSEWCIRCDALAAAEEPAE